MLIDKILNRQSGIVTYGIVPPKTGTDAAKVDEIAARQIRRLEGLDIDGIILYDLQDESQRNSQARPFPFMETIDPFRYGREKLSGLDVPRIIYRAVGKYSPAELSDFLAASAGGDELTVFVGAASKSQQVTMSVNEAYDLRRATRGEVVLGGVVIPERHSTGNDEHARVFQKMSQGCSFFVSQGVYDVDASKNFLSDYYYYGIRHEVALVPIIFTLTPCGSLKTLQFMKWLGISVPRWLENELVHSNDILEQSIDYSERCWAELSEFAANKGIPIGFNVESVAVRKVEVEASIELVSRVTAGHHLRRGA